MSIRGQTATFIICTIKPQAIAAKVNLEVDMSILLSCISPKLICKANHKRIKLTIWAIEKPKAKPGTPKMREKYQLKIKLQPAATTPIKKGVREFCLA